MEQSHHRIGGGRGSHRGHFFNQPVRQSCHGNLVFARVEMEGEGKGREEHGEGEVPIHMMRQNHGRKGSDW